MTAEMYEEATVGQSSGLLDDAATLRVEIVHDPRSLQAVRAAMEDLCRDLDEISVFFEPWFLFSALERLGAETRFSFLCYYETSGTRRLCGFMPLVQARMHPWLPLPAYQIWAHNQCFRCTPLVRNGFADAFWTATLTWLEHLPWHHRLLQLHRLPMEGSLGQTLRRQLEEHSSFRHEMHGFEAAFLRGDTAYADALDKAMSGRTRRKLEQTRRRLEKAGCLQFTDLHDGPAVDDVIEEFLQLEASGWKGKAGTALACNPDEADFFRDVIRAANDREQLSFLALRLDGRMIAGQCAFLAPPGSVLFKVAYDESFAKHSPGTLLEMEELRRLLDPQDPQRARVRWSDSGAGMEAGPTYRTWPDRMPIANCRITTRWTPHAFLVAAWPFLRQSYGNLQTRLQNRHGRSA